MCVYLRAKCLVSSLVLKSFREEGGLEFLGALEFLLIFILKMSKNKKEDDTFLRKKTEEKQNSATVMISVDEIETVFPVKLKLPGESCE